MGGKHEMGKDGMSYSIVRKMEGGERDLRTTLLIIRRKCYKIAMHNGTHVGSLVALHVVALYVLKHIPFIPH